MSELKVITNNKPYRLHALHELPAKAQLDFDYVRESGDYSERFVLYKGVWYDTQDVQRIEIARDLKRGMPVGWSMVVDEDHPFAKWDSIVSDSFFSGVLFRMWDYDHVQCGSYHS